METHCNSHIDEAIEINCVQAFFFKRFGDNLGKLSLRESEVRVS